MTQTNSTFTFTEEMKGFVTFGETNFDDGFEKGKQNGTDLMFHLTISGEVDPFVDRPEHEATPVGYIESSALGRCIVEKGTFNLFTDTRDLNTKKMFYRLFVRDKDGNPITLSGHKRVQDNPGPDLWKDTTTLFTNLFRGHVTAEQESGSEILAAGILHIYVLDFAKQLTTIRTFGPTFSERAAGLEKFSKYFFGSLWEIYGPSFMPAMNHFQREIPAYTLEGVKDADISLHPFSTGDRLGLSLLRYLRKPCDDVVVIIHGLTTSSDMFIMPEHTNLVNYLLDNGFTDVWTMDFRMSNRYPYNLQRHRYTMDDIALYDYPPGFAKVRETVGRNKRIHVICHCLGSVSFMMSLFGKAIDGITSVISNSVALTPRVPRWSQFKLSLGPPLVEYVLGFEYMNPYWRHEPGFSIGKVFAWFVSQFHRECNVPECHMLSFMWGTGFPALYNHENLLDITHERGGDLYGGTSMHYYRHVNRMVSSNNTAVKYDPRNPKYKVLPDNYLQYAKEIETPVLFITGEKNNVFTDSNIVCHERLQKIVPGRHSLRVFPNYGHQDVFMGKNVHVDIFPTLLDFLQQHSGRSRVKATAVG